MKIRLFLGTLLGTILLTACQPTTSKPESPATDSLAVDTTFLQHDFYKQMKGVTQDGTPITMHVFNKGKELLGTWTNDNLGIPMRFIYSKGVDGEILLYPSWADTGDPAFFKGGFRSDSVLEGEWIDLESGKSSPIQLKQSSNGVADLPTEYLRQENCKQRESILQNPPKKEIYWADTTCSLIAMNLLHVHTGKPEVDAAIEAEVLNWVCNREGKHFSTFDAYLQSVDDVKDGLYCFEHDLSVVTNEADVLSLSDWTFLNEGGAHPLSEILHINIDLQTGKTIALTDILKPNSLPKLNEVGGSIYRGDDGSGELMPDTPPFKLPANFAITKAGLLFQFAAYEIEAYAAGLPQVMIPYTQIEDLLLPGGVVARLRGK